MENNKMLKILWSIVLVIFLGSASFLTYSYFSSGDNKTSKTTTTNTSSSNNSSSNSKNNSSSTNNSSNNSDSSTNNNSQNSENSKSTSNDDSNVTVIKEVSGNSTSSSSSSSNTNSSSSQTTNTQTDKTDVDQSSGTTINRSYEYNGKKLSPITGLGTTGKVFSSQKEALAYGQSEVERLVKEDKKSRQYAVGRVMYEDNTLAGWTVDIYEQDKNN